MLSRKGKNNSDGSFNWSDAFIDGAIMAALTFFTSLGGMSVTGVIPNKALLVGAAIAGATQFFVVLAMKRGLRGK